MKLGIITDIHNNVDALNAILNRFDREAVDAIVCLGDIVGIGPWPRETIERLTGIPNLRVVVKGNHDRYLAEGFPDPMKYRARDDEVRFKEWERGILDAKAKSYLAALPVDAWMNISGYRIYVTHYPLDEEGCYVRHIPFVLEATPEQIKGLFQPIDADIILYGHNHRPSLIRDDKWYINVGALGCPGLDLTIARAGILHFPESPARCRETDCACRTWPELQLIREPYDVSRAIDAINRLDCPGRELILSIFYGLR
ncbi:MAG TPA: metallophosphoesterase family protein [Clostridiales bacterium]|jgi:predicted phosphodiesterase|nr:metallophosphoesterase family protein [Clostridiales bacterium]